VAIDKAAPRGAFLTHGRSAAKCHKCDGNAFFGIDPDAPRSMIKIGIGSLPESHRRTVMVSRCRLHTVLPTVAYFREGDADCRALCKQSKIIVGRIRQFLARCPLLRWKNRLPVLVFRFKNTVCVEGKIALPRYDRFNFGDFAFFNLKPGSEQDRPDSSLFGHRSRAGKHST